MDTMVFTKDTMKKSSAEYAEMRRAQSSAEKKLRGRITSCREGAQRCCAPTRLCVREGGVFAFGDRGEGGFEDAEAFVELFIGGDQWDENTDYVVEGAGGDED